MTKTVHGSGKPRVAVVCDFLEEGWESMDLVGDMLLAQLQSGHASELDAVEVRPPMRRRATVLHRSPRFSPAAGRAERALFNADRLVNRFWDYPRHLAARRDAFDLYHIVDHSYAQLVHVVPRARAVVTCHDLEAFRPVVDPSARPKSHLHRVMEERMLSGFRDAARVACVSEAVRDEILAYGLQPPERVAVVPNGVHPACRAQPNPAADARASHLLGPRVPDVVDLLHVGSTIGRKRIDVLLHVFAAVRNQFPRARLIRAGGGFTQEQEKLASELGLGESVLVLARLDRSVLAAMYRRAALVLQPSEAEGFGLPVAEAMACGTPVVASDIPVLREVGGAWTTFCPVGNVPAWSDAITGLLNESRHRPDDWTRRRHGSIEHAAKFGWPEYARRMLDIYHEVLESPELALAP